MTEPRAPLAFLCSSIRAELSDVAFLVLADSRGRHPQFEPHLLRIAELVDEIEKHDGATERRAENDG